MSIKGVDSGAGGLQWPANLRTAEPKNHGVSNRPATAEAARSAKTTVPERAASAQAPEGVDPMLWSVLTTEERMFFSKFRAMGPLTYAPASRTQSENLPRGGRIDITV